jgi:ferredoxin
MTFQNDVSVASNRSRAGQDTFVPSISESLGWSVNADSCAPKLAALAVSALPASEPLPTVSYASRGNLLVVGSDERALAFAESLAASLAVTLLLTSRPSSQAALLAAAGLEAQFPIWSAKVSRLEGYLGRFVAHLEGLTVIRGHDRALPVSARTEFDLVVDFSDPPLFGHHTPPQGYWRVADEASLAVALAEAPESIGEFEKPRFFAYRENLCAHSRSGIEGCNRCIDVCSTEAISSVGDKVEVDPHLCMGCGACASVCPSGAMSYVFPRLPDRGVQLKGMLGAYREAGGKDACLLLHNGTDGRDALESLATEGPGLPDNVIPVEAWHVASTGIDFLLGAFALGANRVAILAAGSEAPEYRDSLREQAALAQTIVQAFGYSGRHFLVVSTPGELVGLEPADGVSVPATFAFSADKRTAVEFAVDHLSRHAPVLPAEIALAAGSPFGEVVVDVKKCTLCLACAGACPEGALMDGGETPALRFLERNCVQCGLCERTCPEEAISLNARLLLGPAARETRVLNETQPFHCVSCGKAFGTKQMVDTMMGRLTGHSMFAGGDALRRLQMCADCRVVDMMSNKNEVSVLKL